MLHEFMNMNVYHSRYLKTMWQNAVFLIRNFQFIIRPELGTSLYIQNIADFQTNMTDKCQRIIETLPRR